MFSFSCLGGWLVLPLFISFLVHDACGGCYRLWLSPIRRADAIRHEVGLGWPLPTIEPRRFGSFTTPILFLFAFIGVFLSCEKKRDHGVVTGMSPDVCALVLFVCVCLASVCALVCWLEHTVEKGLSIQLDRDFPNLLVLVA